MTFQEVKEFEKQVADFFGSPYAVAVDSCTHGIELCLRLENSNNITIPTRTYISIPFLAKKLNLKWEWREEEWQDYYFLGNTNIVDAAVLWEKNSYVPKTFMCLRSSNQHRFSTFRTLANSILLTLSIINACPNLFFIRF